MRHEELGSFARDWARLTRSERATFLTVLERHFMPAAERFRDQPAMPWPRGIRVKRVVAAPGIWEMTWSFAGPDGRATFEWVAIEGEPGIRWRRIGGHEIFARP